MASGKMTFLGNRRVGSNGNSALEQPKFSLIIVFMGSSTSGMKRAKLWAFGCALRDLFWVRSIYSIIPSACGWQFAVRSHCIFGNLVISWNKEDSNCLPCSVSIVAVVPNNEINWSARPCGIIAAIVFWISTSTGKRVKWSIIERRNENPWLTGKGTTTCMWMS